MYLDIGFLSIHISPAFAVFLAISANILEGRIYLLSFVFVFLHELTHILFLRLFGCKSARMNFYPGGIRLSADGFLSLSCKETLLCAVSAPLVNILAGCIFLMLNSEVFRDIAYINFIMGTANLLPLPFLDGGRAAGALLDKIADYRKSALISDVLSIASLLSLGAFTFFIVTKNKERLMWLFFFVYCTIGTVNHKRNSRVS